MASVQKLIRAEIGHMGGSRKFPNTLIGEFFAGRNFLEFRDYFQNSPN